MSTTHASEGLHGTRQLLDELDALMDQMLALPVEESEGAAVLPAAPAETAPTVAATLTLLDPPPAPRGDPDSALPPDAHENRDFLAGVGLASGETAPSRAPGIDERFIASFPQDPPAMSALSHVAAPDATELLAPPPLLRTAAWRPDRLAYRFFVWVNQRYETGTTRLGKAGVLLGSRRGKTLLGMCGLILLAGALAWLCSDWLGWNW